MESTCTFVVDTNAGEDGVYNKLTTLATNVIRKRMDVGDICAMTPKRRYVFERKTWSDLNSSLQDGRWKEQKSRMLGSSPDDDDSTMDTKYIYIIEGELAGWEEIHTD